MAEAQANMAMSQALSRGLSRMFTSHQDDGLGVVLDIVAVGLSIALLPTGLGVLGLTALAGGVFLLGCDSYSYALELGGDDESAEQFKKATERYRIIATVATLPDLAFNGLKAVRELQEVKALRALDQTTARAAESMSARTASSQRAARYDQIAARANLRSQIRTKQIQGSMIYDMTPRGAGIGSTYLMVREEIQNEHSLLNEVTRRMRVHSTSVHK